jgi:SAM-dependent methyltransferase
MSVSQGRKNLMATRGYLNPPSQRLSKSKEMAKRHATNDFTTVSKIEDTVSNYLSLNNYSIAWNDYNGVMSEKIIIRQYLFRDCYCVDLSCPYRKIIIEVLGDWWHGWEVVIGNQKKEDQHPKAQNNLRLDINRFRYIEHSGWTLVKIWEHDVKNGNYKNILDLGCGNGKDIKIFESLGAKSVYGIDSSKFMINEAKKNSSNPKKLFVAEIEKTPFANSFFDIFFVFRISFSYRFCSNVILK